MAQLAEPSIRFSSCLLLLLSFELGTLNCFVEVNINITLYHPVIATVIPHPVYLYLHAEVMLSISAHS